MTEVLQNLSSVVAISENNAIAKDGHIPWDYPEDKKQYKQRTWGETIIVGRVTYEGFTKYQSDYIDSCTVGVLTSDEEYTPSSDEHNVLNSIEEAVEWIDSVDDIVYNLGGGTVYQQLFDRTNQLEVSHIPVEVTNPTVFFPTIDEAAWESTTVEEYERFEIVTYVRTED